MVAPAVLAGGLEVVNFAMGAIGVIGFGMDQVKQDVNNVNVRIRTGLDNTPDPEKKGTKLQHAGGHVPYVQAFNINGDPVGTGGGEGSGHCETGEVCDITVNTSVQVESIKVMAGTDAICIATLGVSSSADKSFGMVGDIWELCGRPWAFSGVRAGADDVFVKCGWIDADNVAEKTGNKINNPQGFKIDIRKFYSVDQAGSQAATEADIKKFKGMDRKEAADKLCKHIKFINGVKIQDNPWSKSAKLVQAPPVMIGTFGVGAPMKQGQLKKRRIGENKLIIAPKIAFGTAAELCASESSTGPDYANIEEGSFCSMETKTLYPICKEDSTDMLCFDVEKEALVHGRTATLVPRQETYKHVTKWE